MSCGLVCGLRHSLYKCKSINRTTKFSSLSMSKVVPVPAKERCRDAFLSWYRSNPSESLLRGYFSSFGEVTSVYLPPEQEIPPFGLSPFRSALVRFCNHEIMMEACVQPLVSIQEHNFIVKPAVRKASFSSTTIRVSPLSPQITENQLREVYSQFGTVETVFIPNLLVAGCNIEADYGMIRFEDEESAQKAVNVRSLRIGSLFLKCSLVFPKVLSDTCNSLLLENVRSDANVTALYRVLSSYVPVRRVHRLLLDGRPTHYIVNFYSDHGLEICQRHQSDIMSLLGNEVHFNLNLARYPDEVYGAGYVIEDVLIHRISIGIVRYLSSFGKFELRESKVGTRVFFKKPPNASIEGPFKSDGQTFKITQIHLDTDEILYDRVEKDIARIFENSSDV